MSQEEIHLRKDIRRSDVDRISDWLQDKTVSKFLNEEQDISRELQQLAERSSLPIFTHVFSQDGQFFMLSLRRSGPIGFLRLVPTNDGTEMVVVIGEKSQWGNGYGYSAVVKGLKKAFYTWREDKVIAKISPENSRSKAVFKKAGFSKEKELDSDELFTVTFEEFIEN